MFLHLFYEPGAHAGLRRKWAGVQGGILADSVGEASFAGAAGRQVMGAKKGKK